MPLRDEYYDQIIMPWGPGGAAMPVSDLNVEPFEVASDGTETPADVYGTRLGGSPGGIPPTGVDGSISFFLEAGNYNIYYSDTYDPPRLTPFVRSFTSQTADSIADVSELQIDIDALLSNVQNWHGMPWQDESDGVVIPFVQQEYLSLTANVWGGYPNESITVSTGPNDLIAVQYSGIFGAVANNPLYQAAIFIDENQLVVPGNLGATSQATWYGQLAPLSDVVLKTTPVGLMMMLPDNNYFPGDVSTGMAQAMDTSGTGALTQMLRSGQYKTNQGAFNGGITYIDVAAGVHTISIRYKNSVSGDISCKKRTLRVGTIPFPS